MPAAEEVGVAEMSLSLRLVSKVLRIAIAITLWTEPSSPAALSHLRAPAPPVYLMALPSLRTAAKWSSRKSKK